MSNQKRRLDARGGRRQPQVIFFTANKEYCPINAATGDYTVAKEGESSLPQKNKAGKDIQARCVKYRARIPLSFARR